MRPPERADMQPSDMDMAFLAAQERQTEKLEKTLLQIHVENRMKRLARECQKLQLLLEETGYHNSAAYLQTAWDSVEDAIERNLS